MSGFNRITKERYLEIKEDAKVEALVHTEKEDKALLVEERKKDFTSEDERIVFIGNLYFPDDDEFLKDYNMYSRNIKLMADNYDVDTYIVRCKVLEMAMFKDTHSSETEKTESPVIEATYEDTKEEENVEVEENTEEIENTEDIEENISDFDDMTDSFLDESSAKVNEISERNVEIETLQKSLIESIRVAKISVSRRNEELDLRSQELDKQKEQFEEYKRFEMEKISNEKIRLDQEEERLIALRNKIMDTIKTFEEAKASLANVFNNEN